MRVHSLELSRRGACFQRAAQVVTNLIQFQRWTSLPIGFSRHSLLLVLPSAGWHLHGNPSGGVFAAANVLACSRVWVTVSICSSTRECDLRGRVGCSSALPSPAASSAMRTLAEKDIVIRLACYNTPRYSGSIRLEVPSSYHVSISSYSWPFVVRRSVRLKGLRHGRESSQSDDQCFHG